MALVLIETPGAIDANTYSTLDEANAYFEARLHKTNWHNSPDRNAALAWATQLLDAYFEWDGNKAASTQALEWPRLSVSDESGYLVSSTAIPAFLKRATAEFAMWLSASDRTADPSSKGVKSIKVDTIEIELDKIDRAPVIPALVSQIVSPYGSKKSTSSITLQSTRSSGCSAEGILTRNIF
jgi:DnaT-like ssDNA binding protein